MRMRPILPQTNKEKRLITILFVLAVFTLIGVFSLIRYSRMEKELLRQNRENTESSTLSEQEAEAASLDDITSIFPDNCNLNEPLPDISFQNEAGETVSVHDFVGNVTIITFWASWCPDCKEELSFMSDFMDIAKKYGDINFIMINKLDNRKETKEKAQQYLTEQKIRSGTYYDIGLNAYKKLGIHSIPTTLFLDKQGVLRAWIPRQITETSVFEGLLKDTIEGSQTVTCDFVTRSMMDERGGVHTVYDTSKAKTNKSDILSETQGGMLEYAVLRNDRELFEKVFHYITSVMWSDGLTAWKVTGDDPSHVNSILDDFRIVSTLMQADSLWGGYAKIIHSYTDALCKYGVRNEQYVDFYDSEYKQFAKRFTLCYGDLRTMSDLAIMDVRLEKPYENAKKLVIEGKISNEFPLYYSWYNYKTNAYETNDLNTAEAMVTLLHLAEAGLLPTDTQDWLKKQMNKEGIKARYTVEGNVVDGYNYDSTAVYALVAMIAHTTGDRELQGLALRKMEKMRIVNKSYPYYGAFGMEDGSGITSFDQVMAMLAYEYTN